MARPDASMVMEAYRQIAESHKAKGQVWSDIGKGLQDSIKTGLNTYKDMTQLEQNQQQINESARHNKEAEKIQEKQVDNSYELGKIHAQNETSRVKSQNATDEQNRKINQLNETTAQSLDKAFKSRINPNDKNSPTYIDNFTYQAVKDGDFLNNLGNFGNSHNLVNGYPYTQSQTQTNTNNLQVAYGLNKN